MFAETVPHPQVGQRYSTLEHPIQSFLWGDYSAKPGHSYEFTIRPVYGTPRNLAYGTDVEIAIGTEAEDGGKHAVYFNRGAIASQAFAEKFGNKAPHDPEDRTDPTTAWLSRGLLEAALHFIDDTRPGEGLRVAAYEFSYAPILAALAAAYERGVDIVIVYEAGQDTVKGKKEDTAATVANARAIKAAKLPKKILRPRKRRNDIPHNKFILRLSKDKVRSAVWTGSTNFTPSGFLGQSNVGHIVRDHELVDAYLSYWDQLAEDTEWQAFRDRNEEANPNPGAPLSEASVSPIFSPRRNDSMLKWYADRISEARGTVMLTAAFGVNATLADALADDRPFLRYVLLEKPLKPNVGAVLAEDRDIQIANGIALGKTSIRAKVRGWKL